MSFATSEFDELPDPADGREPPQAFQPPRRVLLGPGPSAVPPSVLEAMGRPMLGHLDPAFLGLMDEVQAMLRAAFRTGNDLTFPVSGSGSAGMECALANVLEPDDVALVAVSGAFGERMREIAGRCGARVETIGGTWGHPVEPEQVEEALREHPGAKAVCAVHAETSAGVWQPLEEIGDLCRSYGALFVVDAVASMGGIELDVDAWGIDVCYSGTQKCLSVPPGLAPITFSPKGLAAREGRVSGPPSTWYLDAALIGRYVGRERVYHHTAPVSMLYALHEGLRLVLDEGLEARWLRHQEVGGELLHALVERGFQPVAPPGYRLPQLACVWLPEGMDDAPARRRLLDEYGIEVGGGLGEFAGRVWRIGVMGASCTSQNVAQLSHALDQILGT
ncbi:MAG TPA: alanine--glyoxylate aminotransferase family protein [Actinomycetota bacterium]